MSIKPSRHRAQKLCQQSIQLVNAAVLSSPPSDKFPTLQAQEDCSLTIELELLNLTGTRWASHACTLLPMLELFEQLKSRGTSQMTWHHLKCRLIWWPQPGTISARGLHIRRFQFLHLQKWLWEIHSNAMVLSSAPSDKFPTILQAQEECSLTIELELLNLTGTPWASHACTLLPMLEPFEQLKSHGTSQMT